MAAVAAPCAAQSIVCPIQQKEPIIIFSPIAPNSSQPIAITIGLLLWIPVDAISPQQGAVVAVHGNSIDITLSVLKIIAGPPSPPVLCNTVYIGALPRGTYSVNFLIVARDADPQIPNLVATTTLQVTGAPEFVPTISPASVAALSMLLVSVAFLIFRCRANAYGP
jgi:hypothetical protein